jgi:hypothetical protein
MQEYKIFLAGATILTNERDIVRSAVSKWNAKERLNGNPLNPRYVVFSYENFSGVIDSETGNKDYNDFIKNEADLAVFLLAERVGRKTREEFDVAYSELKSSKKRPHLLVLYLEGSTDPGILEIKQILENDEKYYYSYTQAAELDRIIQDELSKLVQKHDDEVPMIKPNTSKNRSNQNKTDGRKSIRVLVLVSTIILFLSSIVYFTIYTPKLKARRKAKEAIEYCDKDKGSYQCYEVLKNALDEMKKVGIPKNDSLREEIQGRIDNY